MQMSNKTGSCLCGKVRYEVDGPLSPILYCHCEQCRKTSGHFVAAAACANEHLIMLEEQGLKWFQSSPQAQRGFCSNCGASVFWRPEHGKRISIMAGTIDAPTELTCQEHIFVADAADYYSIDDGLPQYAEWGPVGIEK